MLIINRTDMLIVAGNALGFFTGSGQTIPLLVDLSEFCRSFSEKSDVTIKNYIGHDFLPVIEVHFVINRTLFLTFGPQFDVRNWLTALLTVGLHFYVWSFLL